MPRLRDALKRITRGIRWRGRRRQDAGGRATQEQLPDAEWQRTKDGICRGALAW